MRRLLIADVHANLPALDAVLRDAGPVDEVLFLGDIVGYGPHPAQCVDLLQRLGALAVAGNHDREVLQRRLLEAPCEPVTWLRWTAGRLTDAHLAYIAGLPRERRISTGIGEILALHHPSGAPYLHPDMPDAELARYFAAASAPIVLLGHSHRLIDRLVGGRRLVCLPAVGQPRDGDPRAGYALESGGELSFHRVEYDVESVVADVREIGLDATFTARWVAFMRTAFDPEWSRPYRRG
ncbi:MAG: metallophosphoesterase family protein [Armatimonadota bacterium]|jgi:diadenosine tetraphosphatase ApaH/serine/threonine PP2A family protein phosphatase